VPVRTNRASKKSSLPSLPYKISIGYKDAKRAMFPLRMVLCVVAVAAYFWLETSVEALAQSADKHDVSAVGRPLELTQVDVFAKQNWTAKDISVLGFYLDMNKVDAVENAHKHGLLLDCVRRNCDVCEKQNGVLCHGITLHLGPDDRVEEIYISKPLDESSAKLRRASVTQQFKGQTYIFFHRYSTNQRLKLFGRESGHEGDNPAVRSTTYLYPGIGIKIYLSLSGNMLITENEADLEVSFVHPTKP
jgi:hypothetical protein